MNQEILSIYSFKKGDKITRLKPLNYKDGTPAEYGLVGKKLTFLGIANASVYLSRTAEMMDIFSMIMGGSNNMTFHIPLEVAEDGWGHYVDPDFIDDEDAVLGLEDEEILRKEIQKASDNDQFERAEQLRQKLEEIKNRKRKDNSKE